MKYDIERAARRGAARRDIAKIRDNAHGCVIRARKGFIRASSFACRDNLHILCKSGSGRRNRGFQFYAGSDSTPRTML